MKAIGLLIALAVILVGGGDTLAQPKPVPPPTPVGFPHVNADWYIPGEIHKFNAIYVSDGNGNSFRSPTRDISAGWSEFGGLTLPRAVFVSGKFRGEANLWLSGNAAWAYASSTLTLNAGNYFNLCAKVASFRARAEYPAFGTGNTCADRWMAYDWVTSGSLSYWTGCTIVGLAGTAYTASNNSAHRFVKIKNNATVTGDTSASFQYSCNAQ